MDHQWHYDYARLAWDAGFVFGNCHPFNIEKSKLSLLDVERVVKERDITTVEQYIPLVIHHVLDADQAEILDSNFVKIFRISQLAIEYLLFCKKYLDNTVVLLKKEMSKLKQQVNILKQQNEECDTNCTNNLRREFLTAVFKCEKCEKAFSSENYLNSHIKRRHTDENISLNDNEDKMQSEIKELKERLNSTDKLLQQIHTSELPTEKNKFDQFLLTDLEKKFYSFREQVENEIASLHLEKNMYEDKYTKLFDLMLQSKEKSNIILETTGTMTCDEYTNSITIAVQETLKTKKTAVDDSTQTDHFKLNELTQETVQKLSINDTKNIMEDVTHDNTNKLEEKISMLSEDIENKISTSMDVIKNQMQIFWEQLKKEPNNQEPEIPNEFYSIDTKDSSEIIKPQVKPRTKLLKPTSAPNIQQHQSILTSVKAKTPVKSSESESTQTVQESPNKMISENVSKRRDSVLQIKAPKYAQDDSLSETESMKTSSTSKDQPMVSQVNKSEKSKISSKSNVEMIIMERINKIIDERHHGIESFQISKKKFQRAKEILSRHQNKKVLKHSPKQKSSPKNIKVFHRNVSKTNTVKIRLNRPLQLKTKEMSDFVPRTVIEIKNKSLFESDSEPDRDLQEKTNPEDSKSDKARSNPTSDKNEIKNVVNSFLKEIPASNSNITKKVLFEDLSSDEPNENDFAVR